MKKINYLFALLILSVTFSSCQKTPEASFTTDKTEYVAGETIKLTNTTINGSEYKWTFPDGQTGAVENYDYKTNDTDPSSSLTFKLQATSKNGKKTDEATKTVNLKAAEGDVLFWQQVGSGFGATVVSLNGVTSNITSEYSGAPDCGASGCAVFNGLKVGSYNYTATDGSSTWSGSASVTKGTCLKINLQ